MGIITQAVLVSIARPLELSRMILSATAFRLFSPFWTRRSLLLAKGNHWRLGTQAETAVLYNCPEMRSCGGARGSKLTTNIITVGAVEEVGERAGGGAEFTQHKPPIGFLYVCFMEVHAEKAVYPPCSSAWLQLAPLSGTIVGVSASIWDT